MRKSDVVAQFLAGCAAVLLLAAVLACLHVHPRLAASAQGGAWAVRGCIDPKVAKPIDWRILPGVTKRVAEALATTCPVSGCDGRLPVVSGIGPVLRERLTASLCRNAGPRPAP